MGDRSRIRNCRHSVLCLLLLSLTSSAEAGKAPLKPEELKEQSDLIVTGKVAWHFQTEKDNRDGSQMTYVYLNVQVLDVEQGAGTTEGETIEVACWTVTRAPRKGTVWDSGHAGIPADGCRARFFLQAHGKQYWDVIFPNGIERLDDGPTLIYPMKPPDPPPSAILAISVGGLAFLLATGVFVWLFVSRRPAARNPES